VLGCSGVRATALDSGTFGTLTRLKNIIYTDKYEYDNYTLHLFDYDKDCKLQHTKTDKSRINIAVGHFLSFPKKLPHWASKDTPLAEEIIEQYPEYDLIVVGDNHTTFVVKDKYVSCGSLTRQTVNQKSHKPCIFKYDGEKLETIYLNVPDAELVMEDEYKVLEKAKDLRMEEFASIAESTDIDETDPKQAFLLYFGKNETRNNTKDLCWGIIEKCEQ
jgi:hypothetical protein